MILRDAIVSDHRHALVGAKWPAPAVLSAGAAVETHAHAATPSAAVVVAALGSVEATVPVCVPPQAQLTFEAVAAWLAVQDGETRTACGSLLADELMQVHESAKREGFAKGHAEGQQAAQRQADAMHARLQQVVTAAEAALELEQGRLAEQCAEIVAAAFTRIAGEALQTREAAAGAVSEVLKRVKEGRELTIKVSATDLPLLQEQAAQLAAAAPTRKFTLVADPRVELGGCIVESRHGSLDGRFEVQLRELYETLRAARVHRGMP